MKKRKKSPPSPSALPGGSLPLSLPELLPAVAVPLWALLLISTYHKMGVRLAAEDWLDFADLLAWIPRVLGAGLGRDLFLLAALWLVFHGAGSVLSRALRLPRPRGLEGFLLPAGLGTGALSLLLLLLGLAGLWHPAFLNAAFWVGAAASGAAVLLRLRSPAAPEDAAAVRPTEGTGLGLLPWLALALLAAVTVMDVLATAAPEIFYDSLTYHLALPKLYLLRGRITPTPENLFSGFPFGIQMLYGLALSLSGEDLAALLHCSFGAAAALGLWMWSRRYADPKVGVLAALLFWMSPIAIYASWNSGIDLGSSFFVGLAFFALCRSLEPPPAGTPAEASRWHLAAGFLIGSAMATKYNVLPLGCVLILVHLWQDRREGRPWQRSFWMAATAGLVLAPWLVKNAVFYGNPLYPFLHKVLGWAAPADWRPVLEAGGSRDLVRTFTTLAGFKELLFQPWNCSTGSWPLGDWPGPAYIFLAPFPLVLGWGLFRRQEGVPRHWTAAAGLAGGGLLVWALTSHLVRFLLPALPIIALAAAVALERGAFPAGLRRFGWAGALFSCVFCFQAAYRQGTGIGQWDLLRGRPDRVSYLKQQRVTYGLPYYAAMEFINTKLPQDAKVLFLGESRGFYCERDFIAATIYDHNPFWPAVRSSGTPAELRDRLKAMGVTHIFLSARQLHFRADSWALMPRDLAAGSLFGEFFARWLDPLYEEREDPGGNPRWLDVYALRDAPKTDPASFTPNPFHFVLKILAKQKELAK